ncbi:MAG: ubiquinol oxidase subunit II [Acidiferrobacter sp.]
MPGRLARPLRLLMLGALLLLSGCAPHGFVLFHPRGPIATAELHFMTIDVLVMSAVVGFTGLLVAFFIWRYRKSSGKGRYDPQWSHSNLLEVLVWGIPLSIVGFLAYYSYKGTFAINPYNPTVLARAPIGAPAMTGATRPSARTHTLDVDVITTDWQWVFIYPHQHIAAVDKLVVPVHTTVRFRLTSATVVNDFFIPQLVGEIDVMPGMRTKQAMRVSTIGTYHGFSADYSGGGFSWMNFVTQAVSPDQFHQWVRRMQQQPRHLTYAAFNRLATPTINLHETPRYFSDVSSGLFDHIIRTVMMGKVYATPLFMTMNMRHMTKVRFLH